MVHLASLAGAILVAGSLGAAGTAYAFEATPMERAELEQLSPQLRQEVEGRIVNGQTVHGVLEAMLLNNVSQQFASGRIVASDFQRGVTVLQQPNGTDQVIPFDTATLTLRK